ESVERAVLASVEGPGDHGSSSGVVDIQLKKIARLVESDPTMGKEVPDLMALFREDVERLEKHPVVLTVTKQITKRPINLTVGGVALRFMVEQMLSNGQAVSNLPALLRSVSIGDYSLLQQQVETLYNDFDSGITLMGRTMDCSAGTPPGRLLQTESEARASLFSDVSRIDMQPEVCKQP